MRIETNQVEEKLTVTLYGRLDTVTSPELEAQLADLGGVMDLKLDFANLEYISSAGLRVLLATTKQMKKKGGKMTVMHVNDDINEVFVITGFNDILTIEL